MHEKKGKKTDFQQYKFVLVLSLFLSPDLFPSHFPSRTASATALAESSRNLACSTRTSGSVSSESAAAGRENDATSNQTPPSSSSSPSFRKTEKLSAPARTCEEQVVALTEKERPGEREGGRRRRGAEEEEGGEEKSPRCRRLEPSSPPPAPPPPERAGTPPRALPSFPTSTISRGLTIQSGKKGRNGPAALAAMTRPGPSLSPSSPPSSLCRPCRRSKLHPGSCFGCGGSRGLLVETQGRASACCHEATALTARS
mgnify:CR=1 FL=1